MKLQRIYLCDNSIDGIFTAIYRAWSTRYGHGNNMIQVRNESNEYNLELFSEYIQVDTDDTLAAKVSRSIQEKISEEAYQMVCRVALSEDAGKGDLIYRFLIIGFSMGEKVMGHFSNEIVGKMFQINRNVSNEVHHLLGFVRFSQHKDNILTSVIHPKNNVLSLIAPHFVDRLPEENFLIYDENRGMAVLHTPGKPWFLVDSPHLSQSIKKNISLQEEEYRDLWKIFHKKISIQERTNPILQRSNMPIRFRGDMTEFNEKQTNK